MTYTALDVLRAWETAKLWHKGQMYGDVDYMFHITAVHDKVVEVYGHQAYLERVVAMLHDIIEDTLYTEAQLYEDFGGEAFEAVYAMTKRPGEDYFDYIPRVKVNPIAVKVKKCDSFCNLTQSFKEQRHKGIIKYTTVLQLLEAD